MKKLIFILGLASIISLNGCMTMLNNLPRENPFNNYSPNQIKSVPSAQLCYVALDHRFKPNQIVFNELQRRGYRDCSESELYCRESLNLNPNSQAYMNCRLSRDQYDLNVMNSNRQTAFENQQLLNEQQAIWQARQPQQINVTHNDFPY